MRDGWGSPPPPIRSHLRSCGETSDVYENTSKAATPFQSTTTKTSNTKSKSISDTESQHERRHQQKRKHKNRQHRSRNILRNTSQQRVIYEKSGQKVHGGFATIATDSTGSCFSFSPYNGALPGTTTFASGTRTSPQLEMDVFRNGDESFSVVPVDSSSVLGNSSQFSFHDQQQDESPCRGALCSTDFESTETDSADMELNALREDPVGHSRDNALDHERESQRTVRCVGRGFLTRAASGGHIEITDEGSKIHPIPISSIPDDRTHLHRRKGGGGDRPFLSFCSSDNAPLSSSYVYHRTDGESTGSPVSLLDIDSDCEQTHSGASNDESRDSDTQSLEEYQFGHGPSSTKARWPLQYVFKRLRRRARPQIFLQTHNDEEHDGVLGQGNFECTSSPPHERNRSASDSFSNRSTRRAFQRLLGKNFWPMKLPSNDLAKKKDFHLPLHLKHVGRLDWSVARSFVLPHLLPIWDLTRALLCDPNTIREYIGDVGRETNLTEAALSDEDMTRLLRFNIIEPLPSTSIPLASCKVFSVVERAKHRRRMIIEPTLNRYIRTAGSIQLPTVEEVVAATDLPGAVQFDFSSFYNHFELPSDARDFYCFKFQGNIYRMKVICTGSRQCPALAQALSESLASRAAGTLDVMHHTYIDNIRFAGSASAATMAAANLVALCKEIGITISDDVKNEFSHFYEFLGITFDHAVKQVSLSTKTINKLIQIEKQLSQASKQLSCLDLLKIVGLQLWSCRVLGIHLGCLYRIFKLIRRRSNRLLNDAAEFWPSLVQPTIHLIRDLCSTQRDITRVLDSEITLYTDACPSGWGSVLVDEKRVITVRSGSFQNEEDIAILECRALKYACLALTSRPTLTNINIFIDNTSVVGAYNKQLSTNEILNFVNSQISHILTSKNWVCTKLKYITSEANPADPASRSAHPVHFKDQL